MKTNIFLWMMFTAVAFLVACAQIVTPQGGPKDSTPPKVKSCKPAQQTTNFSQHSFSVIFDEYIQITDVQNQFQSSPPLRELPEMKVKLKTLQVSFKDTLESNTTYVFNFGNSISDINENNKLEKFKYVFSTGASIDSFIVSGKVRSADYLKTEKGIYVLLYKKNKFSLDSFPFKYAPSYYSKTNEDGTFAISNVGKGEYKICALKDLDNNLRFSSPEEEIAFKTEILLVDSNMSNINLYSFVEEKQRQFVKQMYSSQFGKLTFVFNKPAISPYFEVLGKAPIWSFSDQHAQQDTVDYWFDGSVSDSLKIKVSADGMKADTFKLKLLPRINKLVDRGKANNLALTSTANLGQASALDYMAPITINFSNPITSFDSKKVVLTNYKDTIVPNVSLYDNAGRVVHIESSTLKQDSSYRLYCKKGAFTDVFGIKSDSAVYTFKLNNSKRYGNLKLNIKSRVHSPIMRVEIKDDKMNTVRVGYIDGNGPIFFNMLKAQKYTVRIYEDRVENAKWTTGCYKEQRQPEKVFLPSKIFTVRENWDLEESIDLTTIVE